MCVCVGEGLSHLKTKEKKKTPLNISQEQGGIRARQQSSETLACNGNMLAPFCLRDASSVNR